MIETSLAEVARVTRGTVHGDPTTTVTGPAYVDSRAPSPRGLFVAVRGERSDGHDHADRPGHRAHAVLGSRPTSRPTVVVADPVVALARLSRHVVDTVRPAVLAVTGSSGKTTTKDLLGHLLPEAVATRGNLNNELGVPLTVLRAERSTEVLVLEMGARGVGHLTWLCEAAPPTVAAVLGVGTAHLGEFGSQDLVARAKGELVEALPPTGTAVLNADDPRVVAMAARTRAHVLTFGRRGDVSWTDVRLDRLGRASFRLHHAGRAADVRLRLTGSHQVANAAAAAATALAHGLDLDLVAHRLTTAAASSPLRMQVRERGDGLLVLDDTYNANPESVRAAIAALADLGRGRAGRTVAVLGEMRELGALAPAAHREVGLAARAAGIDVVVAVGAAAAPVADGFGRGLVAVDRAAAAGLLDDLLRPDDTVLVKASRGAGLDLLVSDLQRGPDRGRHGGTPRRPAAARP